MIQTESAVQQTSVSEKQVIRWPGGNVAQDYH